MTPKELFDQGQLQDAIQALGGVLRQRPDDSGGRWFLFELLCFAGEYVRASKQLDVLAGVDGAAEKTADFYRAVLVAEQTRQQMFQRGETPEPLADSEADVAGVLNGRAFQHLVDDDERIGSRLEMLVNGSYLWMPWRHIARVEMSPPRRLRDLLWAPAEVRTSPELGSRSIDGVLLPLLVPLTWKHSDDAVRLGRVPAWQESPNGQFQPFGPKLWLVDGEEFQLPDLRKLEFSPEAPAS